MNLHAMLGLGPDEYMIFCRCCAIILVMSVLVMICSVMAYASGRSDAQAIQAETKRMERLDDADRITREKILNNAVCMLNCMIECGEEHTAQSREVVRRALHPEESGGKGEVHDSGDTPVRTETR